MSDPLVQTLLYSLCAYLLGSLPSAVLICRLMGLSDPRQQGSGNPGASNVLRIGNKKAAFFTLCGDVGKGWCAVAIPGWLEASVIAVQCCAIAVLVGHLFPVFAGFQGGKGVATAIGICLALSIPLGLVQMSLWSVLISIGRIASLASIGTALISPLLAWLIEPALLLPVSALGLLLIFTHRHNITRLVRGKETRF